MNIQSEIEAVHWTTSFFDQRLAGYVSYKSNIENQLSATTHGSDLILDPYHQPENVTLLYQTHEESLKKPKPC